MSSWPEMSAFEKGFEADRLRRVEGLSYREASARIGAPNKNAIAGALKRYRNGTASKRKPRPRIAWTAEQDSLLRRRWRDGAMVKIIAHELGTYHNAVLRRANDLGLPKRLRNRDTYNFAFRLPAGDHTAVMREAGRIGITGGEYLRRMVRDHFHPKKESAPED